LPFDVFAYTIDMCTNKVYLLTYLLMTCSTTQWASTVRFVTTGFSGRPVCRTTVPTHVILASVTSSAPLACASKTMLTNTLA